MQLLHLKPQLISLLLLKLVLKVTAVLVVLAMAIVSNKVLVVLRQVLNNAVLSKDLAWILKSLACSSLVNNSSLKNMMLIRMASFPKTKSRRSTKILRRNTKLSVLKF
jgi:hypothetical protein